MNQYWCQSHGQYSPTTMNSGCPMCYGQQNPYPFGPSNYPPYNYNSTDQLNNKLDKIIELLERINEK